MRRLPKAGTAMIGFDLIVVPDEEDKEAAEIFVDGTIGDREYRFLLDSGAAGTCVVLDDYTDSFHSSGTHDSSGVFAKHTDDLITVPLIRLGPIAKENLTITRLAQDAPGIRSLIGMDVLKEHCFHFLFDEHRVLVDPHDLDNANFRFQQLAFDRKFHTYVEVMFGEFIASTVWDTGAGITVADLGFIKEHPSYFEEVGRSRGTDSTGFEMETPMFIMTGATVAGHTLAPHTVAGVDLSHVNATIEMPMNMILGYSTLSKANWLFDFPGKRWAITKLLGGK